MRYEFDDYTVDESGGVALHRDQPVEIGRRAFLLLTYLIRHRDRVVSKDELVEVLWNGALVSDSSLPRCMNALRSALGNRERGAGGIIETVYGHGYRFRPLVCVSESSMAPPDELDETGAAHLGRFTPLECEASQEHLAPIQEAKLRLELAALQARSGSFSDARDNLRRTLELARGVGDGALFGEAAIALRRTYMLVYGDSTQVPDILLEAIPLAGSSALSLELKAEFQVAYLALSGPEERCAAVRKNIAESDSLEEPHSRARILLSSHLAMDGPGTMRERRELSERAFKAAHFVGDPRLHVEASHTRLCDALAAGEIARFESELEVFQELARDCGENLWLARAGLADSLRATVRGRFDLAIERRDHALSFLEEGSEDHKAVLRATRFAIGRERMEEMLRLTHTEAAWREPIALISMSLAMYYLGLREDSKRIFDMLAPGWSQSAIPSRTWKSAIALYAEAAFLLDDPRAAERIVSEISRCGNVMPSLDAFICMEPYAYFLGLAETAHEAWDKADRHFHDAVSRCKKMGAPGFEARASYAWGLMLMRRGASKYKNAARSKATFAHRVAGDLGMDRLRAEAAALLDQIPG